MNQQAIKKKNVDCTTFGKNTFSTKINKFKSICNNPRTWINVIMNVKILVECKK
jgi:hypothetical protein